MPPSYQDGDDQAYVYLLNPTGGIVQGDRLETEVVLEPGARALLTTQSATKVYRMERGYAEELNRYTLRGDAVLEYLPDQTIPFAGARFYPGGIGPPHAPPRTVCAQRRGTRVSLPTVDTLETGG